MFARAFGIFCCFFFSTAAAASAAAGGGGAAACFCYGCLCCCCCCCCSCCYCTTYCWLVLLGVLYFILFRESYMVVDVVVKNPQKSNVYKYEKNMNVVTPRCADAAAVVSAAVLRRPTKEYTHPYSMMHRRLSTAGNEVAPHYHQLLVVAIF